MNQTDHQLLQLIYAEILHLKKLLISQGIIKQSDDDEYLNKLNSYMSELNAKNREIAKVNPSQTNY